MKRILFLLALFVALSSSVFSQNKLDPQSFDFSRSSAYDFNWNDSHFIRGWNWGSPSRKIDSALSINYYHDHLFVDGCPTISKDSTIIGHRSARGLVKIASDRTAPIVLNGQSLYLEPNLKIDSTDSFTYKAGKDSAIYGFTYIKGDTTSDKRRLTLNSSAYNGVVLKNMWRGDPLRHLMHGNVTPDTSATSLWLDSINGKIMYLSINIKNLSAMDTSNLDLPVLSIKVPCKIVQTRNDSNFTSYDSVYFSHFPRTRLDKSTFLDTVHIVGNYFANDYRGLARRVDTGTTVATKEWIITKRMLRCENSANKSKDSSITLSAMMYFDIKTSRNYQLTQEYIQDGNYTRISNLDLEVKYYNNHNIAIDWIRFETPQAQKLFRGFFDDSIHNEVLRAETLISDTTKNTSLEKINRFYAIDEVIPAWYGAFRYFNALTGWRSENECKVHEDNKPAQYYVATGQSFYWAAGKGQFTNGVAVPYIKLGIFGDDAKRVFGLQRGFQGRSSWPFDWAYRRYDTLSSDYETAVPDASLLLTKQRPLSEYDTTNYYYGSPYFIDIISDQMSIEMARYSEYYCNPSLLFGNHKWVSNIWFGNGGWARDDSRSHFYLSGGRTQTAEELRTQMMSSLILGAKGMLFYTKQSMLVDDNKYAGEIGVIRQGLYSIEKNFTPDALIYSDTLGGDFYNSKSDIFPLCKNFDPTWYMWDTLGIPQSRIYIGAKSERTEAAKTLKWIAANENTLMKLKLVSWRASGYHTWTSADPKFSSSILGKYIDTTSIHTRKLWNPRTNEAYNTTDYENKDSSFYDITLLRNDTDSLLTSGIYFLGIQNRRTDPLVRPLDTFNVGYKPIPPNVPVIAVQVPMIDSCVKFYSSAEFDLGVQNGGNIFYNKINYDTTKYRHPDTNIIFRKSGYWRDLWWKRFGCREVTIPIKVPKDVQSASSVATYSVQINELGYSDKTLNAQFWRKNNLTDLIGNNVFMSYFSSGSTIKQTLKLLPGEAKILCVAIFSNTLPKIDPNTTVSITKNTSSKKVVKNGILSSGQDTIRYHSVYSHIDPIDSIMKVYYARSKPMTKIVAADSIQWEDYERLISVPNLKSSSIVTDRKRSTMTLDTNIETIDTTITIDPNFYFRKAGHPNIVVDNSGKVHIVYNIEPDSLYQGSTKINLAIAECVFNANDSIQTIPDSVHIIQTITADTAESDKYGIPAINATDNKVFYAWNSHQGIFASVKNASDSGIISSATQIRDNADNCGRPSMNRYSTVSPNVDNCSLVWAENNDNESHIYYTRLFPNSKGNVDFHVAGSFMNPNSELSTQAYINGGNIWDGSQAVARISDAKPNENCLPVVYRSLAPNASQYNEAIYDRIYWESKEPCGANENENRAIFSKLIDVEDEQLSALPQLMIFGENQILADVDVAQGYGDMINGDNAVCAAFAMSGLNGEESRIVKFNHGLWSFYDTTTNAYTYAPWQSLPPKELTISNENEIRHPSITRMSAVSAVENYNLSNVFYSDAVPSVCDDQTNGRRFKRSNNSVLSNDTANYAIPLVGFAKSDTANGLSYISSIYDANSGTYLKYKYGYRSLNGKNIGIDSIYSEWLSVGQLSNIAFTYFNKVDTNVKVFLEKQNASSLINITQYLGRLDTIIGNNLTLINGANDLYRVLILKNHANTAFKGAYSISTKKNVAAKVASKHESETIIDLGAKTSLSYNASASGEITLNLYPNSASGDYVYAVLYGDNALNSNSNNLQIKLSVNSILGEKVLESELKLGEVQKLGISNLPNGSYIVNAQIIDKNNAITITTKTASLSIAR